MEVLHLSVHFGIDIGRATIREDNTTTMRGPGILGGQRPNCSTAVGPRVFLWDDFFVRVISVFEGSNYTCDTKINIISTQKKKSSYHEHLFWITYVFCRIVKLGAMASKRPWGPRPKAL